MPFRPWPVAYQSPPSRGSAPMIGSPSGVTGRRPDHVRRIGPSMPAQRRDRAGRCRASPAEVTSGSEPDILHRRPGDRLVPAGDQVTAVAVDDGALGILRPGERRPSGRGPAPRRGGAGTPSRAPDHAPAAITISAAPDTWPARPTTPDDTVTPLIDAERRVVHQPAPQPGGVRQERADELLGLERALRAAPRGRPRSARARATAPSLRRRRASRTR